MGSCPTCLAIWDQGDRCPRCHVSAQESLEDIRTSMREEMRKAVAEATAEPAALPQSPPAATEPLSPVEEIRANLREELQKAIDDDVQDPPPAPATPGTPAPESASEPAPIILDVEIPAPGPRRGAYGQGRRSTGVHPLEVRYWAAVGGLVMVLLLLSGRGREPDPAPFPPARVTSVTKPAPKVWVPDDAPPAATAGVTVTAEPS